jgi:glucokinase
MRTDATTVIALDVGGSSVKSGVVRAGGRVHRRAYAPIDSSGTAEQIVAALQSAIERHMRHIRRGTLRGIAFGFPGPFDYSRGVSYIGDVQKKYDAIYGLDLRAALRGRLGVGDLPIVFRNDAEAAIVGEARYGAARGYDRLIGVTLGTGCGSAFLERGTPVRSGDRVPPNGELYAELYHGAMADDLFSARGLRARLQATDPAIDNLANAAAAALAGDTRLSAGFAAFGSDLGAFLAPYVRDFGAEIVLVLGGIARSLGLFQSNLASMLPVPVLAGALGTDAALLGAADLLLRNRPRISADEADARG